MQSGGGIFAGPSLPRAEWRARIEKSLPGLRFVGGQGRLDRNGGSIEVDLGDEDPLSNLEIRWSGPGPAVAARRLLAEHGLKPSSARPGASPATSTIAASDPPRGLPDHPPRRRRIVTACFASAGCAIILLAAVFAARPHLEAQLMAHNETQALERLRELSRGGPRENLPIHAGYVFEPFAGSARSALRARPLLPGVTGGGWFILMEGRIYRDPEFDRLAALDEAEREQEP